MKLSKEKIEELKKLMGFGFLMIQSFERKEIEIALKTSSANDLVPILARMACGYDAECDENKLCEMFREPATTEILEEVYADYLEYSKIADEL